MSCRAKASERRRVFAVKKFGLNRVSSRRLLPGGIEDEDDCRSIFHHRPFVVFAVNDSQMVPQIRRALSRGFVS